VTLKRMGISINERILLSYGETQDSTLAVEPTKTLN
jgi:hypothetical protein